MGRSFHRFSRVTWGIVSLQQWKGRLIDYPGPVANCSVRQRVEAEESPLAKPTAAVMRLTKSNVMHVECTETEIRKYHLYLGCRQ